MLSFSEYERTVSRFRREIETVDLRIKYRQIELQHDLTAKGVSRRAAAELIPEDEEMKKLLYSKQCLQSGLNFVGENGELPPKIEYRMNESE